MKNPIQKWKIPSIHGKCHFKVGLSLFKWDFHFPETIYLVYFPFSRILLFVTYKVPMTYFPTFPDFRKPNIQVYNFQVYKLPNVQFSKMSTFRFFNTSIFRFSKFQILKKRIRKYVKIRFKDIPNKSEFQIIRSENHIFKNVSIMFLVFVK